MTDGPPLRQPSALLPLAMSVAALTIVLRHILVVGIAAQADEGAEAHLFQLLLLAQLPVVAYFAIKWLPRAPVQALVVLALQVAAGLAALAPVFLLRW